MAESHRFRGLSPGAWALAACLAAFAGLAAIVVGIATGNVPLLVAGYPIVFGAGLVPSAVDLHRTKAALEAIHQRNKEQAAIGEPVAVERNVERESSGRVVWIELEQPRLH